MVTAIVLIDVEADRIAEAAQQIADLAGVDQVYSCAGDVDLIAVSRPPTTRESPTWFPATSRRSRV